MGLKVDELVGQRFERWVVLERTQNKSKAPYYHCKCDCGNEKDVAKSSLIKGKSKSCGCLNKELLRERAIDITGNRYGKLVAVRFDHCGDNGQRYWLCKCDCGNETIVDRHNLRDNDKGTRSCGCLLNDQMEERFEDLTGQKFGRLLIIGFEGRDKNGQQWWSYICDCGTVGHISRNSLLSAGTRSCGCLSIEVNVARAEDLIGQKFGKLTVIAKAERRDPKVIRWLCKCDCGNEVEVDCNSLKAGKTRSCGCLHAEAAEARVIDLTGRVFGRLTVIGRDYNNEIEGAVWVCKCSCGRYKSIRSNSLLAGRTRSCGCLIVETSTERCTTHGLSHTRLHGLWLGIKSRCNNYNRPNFNDYGGRGIKVCDEWLEDFMSFYNWAIENDYDDTKSIDRIDNDGPYSPENCRWATDKEQNRNTRRNVYIEAFGEIKTLGEWSEISGVNSRTIKHRYSVGKRGEDLFIPVNKTSKEHNKRKRLTGILCGVKSRCYNPKSISYKNYGGRGIYVCEEWLNDFEFFYEWALGNGYNKSLTLDRIDNDGPYSPENCRWATNQEQSMNRRNSILLTHNDVTMTREAWSRVLGISAKALAYRIENNMTEDKIFHIGKLPGGRMREDGT